MMNQPDPRKHQLISFAKSGIRIGGCLAAAVTGSVLTLAVSLLVAEIVGVWEELV
jgi:tetrahydromethanopterin S-methyltransferase subunit B